MNFCSIESVLFFVHRLKAVELHDSARDLGRRNVGREVLAHLSDRVSLARYVVCKGLKVGIDDVREYLFSVNIKINQLQNSDSDVNLVVPLEVIKGDHEFTDYMTRSNER